MDPELCLFLEQEIAMGFHLHVQLQVCAAQLELDGMSCSLVVSVWTCPLPGEGESSCGISHLSPEQD